MSSMSSLIFVIWINFLYGSAEIFQNPTANNITCGISGPCSIICDKANACESTKFYLYSNDATITCSGDASCRSTQIISVNATSLTLDFNGRDSFKYGTAFIQQSDHHITTHCDEELGLLLTDDEINN